jgi:anti-sigma B factor antagonist
MGRTQDLLLPAWRCSWPLGPCAAGAVVSLSTARRASPLVARESPHRSGCFPGFGGSGVTSSGTGLSHMTAVVCSRRNRPHCPKGPVEPDTEGTVWAPGALQGRQRRVLSVVFTGVGKCSRWVRIPPLLLWQEGVTMTLVHVSVREGDGQVVVVLRGVLDVVDAVSVAAALAAVAAPEREIIVDLAGLAFMDSSGVAALVHGRKQARAAGGELLLAAPQPQVLRVLVLTRLTDVFHVCASVDEAARSVRRSRGWRYRRHSGGSATSAGRGPPGGTESRPGKGRAVACAGEPAGRSVTIRVLHMARSVPVRCAPRGRREPAEPAEDLMQVGYAGG